MRGARCEVERLFLECGAVACGWLEPQVAGIGVTTDGDAFADRYGCLGLAIWSVDWGLV